MFSQNERGIERILRLILGLGLLSYGYWLSGNYWLDYQIARYQIPCWEWSNFSSHGCLVERGLFIAAVGLVPLITGLVGWCPIKSLLRIKP